MVPATATKTDAAQWNFASGKAAALESLMLSDDLFKRLLRQDNLHGLVQVVSESRYRELFPNAQAVADADAILAPVSYTHLRAHET